MARKPKDTSFSLSRYWRTIGRGHRHAIVMVLVLLALLSIALIHVNSANIERSAAQLAKRLEAERREAANLEARRKCVHSLCLPALQAHLHHAVKFWLALKPAHL